MRWREQEAASAEQRVQVRHRTALQRRAQRREKTLARVRRLRHVLTLLRHSDARCDCYDFAHWQWLWRRSPDLAERLRTAGHHFSTCAVAAIYDREGEKYSGRYARGRLSSLETGRWLREDALAEQVMADGGDDCRWPLRMEQHNLRGWRLPRVERRTRQRDNLPGWKMTVLAGKDIIPWRDILERPIPGGKACPASVQRKISAVQPGAASDEEEALDDEEETADEDVFNWERHPTI